MWNKILILFFGFLLVDSRRNITGESRLFKDIILNNVPYERPVYNKSNNITVEFDFHLRSVSHFLEAQERLVCTGWFVMSWMDEFLTWEPSLYNGTESVRPPSSYVWKPDIVAANSFQQMNFLGGDFVSMKLYSSGLVEWKPGDIFSIPCEVDIDRYPFDGLVCYLELVVWSYSESEVNLQPTKTSAGTGHFRKSGQWSLLSTSVELNAVIVNTYNGSRVVITMLLDRQPTNFVFSFILPVLILSLLGTFVFLIPSDSGEKISFAITIPLSYGVYMSFLTTMVPQTSHGTSVFVIFLGLTLLLSAIFVILSIFSVRVSGRKESSRPISSRIQKLTLWVEAVKTRCRQKQITDLSNIVDTSQTDRSKNVLEPMTWVRVSKAFDLLFFCIFSLPLIVSIPSIFIFIFLFNRQEQELA